MDHSRFDRLARGFGRSGTRRAALALLLGGVSAGISREAMACIATDKRCSTKKRDKCDLCCSYFNDGTYCRCKPDRKSCGNDLECCSGLCSFTGSKGRCS